MIVRGFPEHTEVLAPVPLASQIQVQLEQFVCLLCISGDIWHPRISSLGLPEAISPGSVIFVLSSITPMSSTECFAHSIKDGFDRLDKAFHLVNPELREEHLRRLAEAGINVQEAMDRGQLEVRQWQDAPLRGDRFDQDTWLASFEQVLQSGPKAGYAQTRFLAHMEWALFAKQRIAVVSCNYTFYFLGFGGPFPLSRGTTNRSSSMLIVITATRPTIDTSLGYLNVRIGSPESGYGIRVRMPSFISQ
jgi:hypothetical protein